MNDYNNDANEGSINYNLEQEILNRDSEISHELFKEAMIGISAMYMQGNLDRRILKNYGTNSAQIMYRICSVMDLELSNYFQGLIIDNGYEDILQTNLYPEGLDLQNLNFLYKVWVTIKDFPEMFEYTN